MSRANSEFSVVHITTVHPPFDPRIFHKECVSAAEAGFRTTLLAYLDVSESRNGVQVVSLGPRQPEYGRLALRRRARRARSALHAALGLKADIYQVHDPELLPTAIALKRRTGAKVLYDCHEDNVGYALHKTYIPRLLRKPVATAISLYEKHAATRLDAVVTADDGVRDRFERLGARAVTVHNFPRLELFDVPPVAKEIDLVYHGTLPPYHVAECFAIDDALRRRGRLVRWSLFGHFSDLSRTRAEAMARGAADRFQLGGPVPHEEVARKVATARVGIIPLPDLPKFQSNLPTKLFEFMALRLPVVLSDLPPSRRFVGDGRCALLIPPSNAEAYADAIIRLLDQPSLCREMGEEGRRRVEQRYNWRLESARLIALYRELLENGSA